ncbi:hypothetical protein AB6A40_010291 [Gnathostoma spinigerum]|uniref:Uncharacterized protein n=1 Tax=Gnathostoma spinigerum TaxID=75299 RepID=A0ABD6F272_9BILA
MRCVRSAQLTAEQRDEIEQMAWKASKHSEPMRALLRLALDSTDSLRLCALNNHTNSSHYVRCGNRGVQGTYTISVPTLHLTMKPRSPAKFAIAQSKKEKLSTEVTKVERSIIKCVAGKKSTRAQRMAEYANIARQKAAKLQKRQRRTKTRPTSDSADSETGTEEAAADDQPDNSGSSSKKHSKSVKPQ